MGFLAVPRQLNRWPCPLVGRSGTANNQSLHNTTEWPQRLVTFETFDQSDEGTWPDQQKDNDKDKYIYINSYLSPFYFLSNLICWEQICFEHFLESFFEYSFSTDPL